MSEAIAVDVTGIEHCLDGAPPDMAAAQPHEGTQAQRQTLDLELLARVAKSDCLGRTGYFDCSAMDWFLERAQLLGVEHAPPEPIVAKAPAV